MWRFIFSCILEGKFLTLIGLNSPNKNTTKIFFFTNPEFYRLINFHTILNLFIFIQSQNKKMKIVLFSLLTLFIVISSNQQLPGFKLTVTQKGLTFINKVAKDILIKELTGFVIEEQEGDVDTPIGKIDYKIEKLTVNKLKN